MNNEWRERTQSTDGGGHVNATGSALFEVFSTATSFSSLSLPMRPYKSKLGVWSANALLFRADAASGARLGAPLASHTFNLCVQRQYGNVGAPFFLISACVRAGAVPSGNVACKHRQGRHQDTKSLHFAWVDIEHIQQ
jgi:hypothetical protein